jgi:hypothetical protein
MKHFKAHYEHFCQLPLSQARRVMEHRTGYAPVTVTIGGRFGVTYIGGPAKPVPTSETRQLDDPTLAWMMKPHPIQPSWNDFDIDGQHLFPACADYLNRAQLLSGEARRISDQVHNAYSLSVPPT